MNAKTIEQQWGLFQTAMPASEVFLSAGQYIVQHTRDISEIYQLMQLRAKVFSEDFGRANHWPHLDYDRFDIQCMHLMVKHVGTGELIGTYRLNPGGPFGLYSETEFEMSQILKQPGFKLELGRAAILKEHRNGVTLDLLWRAIAMVSQQLNARYLLGTSSVPTVCPEQAASLQQFFIQQGHVIDQHMDPIPFQMIPPNAPVCEGMKDAKEILPPLLRTYIQAGAKVSSRAAYDAEFKCIDYLTVLDLQQLSPSFQRRYFRHLNERSSAA